MEGELGVGRCIAGRGRVFTASSLPKEIAIPCSPGNGSCGANPVRSRRRSRSACAARVASNAFRRDAKSSFPHGKLPSVIRCNVLLSARSFSQRNAEGDGFTYRAVPWLK